MGYDNLTTIQEKLSYVLTMIAYKIQERDNLEDVKKSNYFRWLSEVIEEYTGSTLILETLNGFYPIGYIDHQSTDTLDDYWSDDEIQFKNNMKEIIFNNKYHIIIDNDNH